MAYRTFSKNTSSRVFLIYLKLAIIPYTSTVLISACVCIDIHLCLCVYIYIHTCTCVLTLFNVLYFDILLSVGWQESLDLFLHRARLPDPASAGAARCHWLLNLHIITWLWTAKIRFGTTNTQYNVLDLFLKNLES